MYKKLKMYNLVYLLLFSIFTINKVSSTPQTKPSQKEDPTELTKTQDQFKTLDQFNPGSGSSNRECQHCVHYISEQEPVLTPEQESELFQKCAVDLCGPANKSPKYIFDNTFVDKTDIYPEIIERFNEKIRPSVEKAIQAELDYDRQILDILAEKISNPSKEWDKIAQILYEDLYENISIHSTMLNNPPGATTPGTNTRTRQQTYKDAHAFLKERYQEFFKKNKETAFTEEDERTINQIGQKLERDNLDSIDLFKSTHSLDDLIKRTKTAFCSNKLSCKTWIHSELSNLHQRMEQNLKEKEKRENIDQYLQYCLSIYDADVRDARQIKTFNEKLGEYKNRFLEKTFFPPYSDESKKLFGDYINNQLNVAIPPSSRENAERDLVEKIASIASIFKYPSLGSSTIAQKVKNKDDESKSFNVCPSPIRKRFRSNIFLYHANTVRIDFFNCTFHEHGKQVLAHELAHAMSDLFGDNKLSEDSYEPYLKLRECATNRYKTSNQSPPIFGVTHHQTDTYKDKYKTEEDVGDLIAYQVFQDDPTLMGCTLLTPTKDGNQYKPLKMLDTRYYSSDDYYGDSHSEPLLRIIIEAIYKRKELPSTCQQAVDIYSNRINFKPCF